MNALRVATSSLSSRALTQSARPTASKVLRRSAAPAMRWYSESATEKPAAESSETSKSEEDASSGLEAELKAKAAEVVDITGRLRYLQADFLNLQRNAAREKEQTRDFAITRFAGDLLETVDVLSLALKSVPTELVNPPAADASALSSTTTSADKTPADHLRDLYNGVELTHRQLLQTLFKYHVKPFDPVGDKFDPNRHEALYQAPVPGKEPGTVIDCQKIGFTIKDRVLRAAQVGVAQETS
ncbi:GrpE-domain-containing protein [Peniophora sp. CONT]|nr:GrpE-domain-containing protein [Peniophora sp. CONT]